MVIMICLISSICFAGASDTSIDKILRLSGLEKQIAGFSDLFKAGMEQARQEKTSIPEDMFLTMTNTIDKYIVSSDILEEIGSSLKKSLDKKDIEHLMAWYESDLGKKITVAEEQAATPEAYMEVSKSVQALMGDRERVAFSKRIDKFFGATDMAMKLQEYSSMTSYTAMMTALYPDRPLDLDKFKAQMALYSARTRSHMELVITSTMVYSYKNIDLESLKKYESFIKDSKSAKFNKIAMESMFRGLEKSISKWTEAFAAIVKKRAM